MSQDIVATYTSFESVMLTVLALLVIAIFGGALYAFFSAIFLFIFSKGDPEKNNQAWDSIKYMMWGIILTVILLLFFPTLVQYLGVKYYDIFEAKNIFRRVGEIMDSAMDLGKDVTASQKGGSNGGFEANPDAMRDYSL